MKKLLCALMTAAVCLLLAGCLENGRILQVSQYDQAERYSVGNFTCAADGVRAVEIEWTIGKVQLTQSTDGTLRGEETAEGFPEEQRMRWLLDGDTLRVHFAVSGFSGHVKDDKTLRIEIPQGADLRIDSGSADLEIGALDARKIDIQTNSGAIRMGDTHADALLISNTAGSTELGLLDVADEAVINCTHGNIRVEAVQAPLVRLESTAGNVTALLYRCGEAYLHSTGGSVRLRIPADQGATVQYSTTSGSVKGGTRKTSDTITLGNGEITCRAKVSSTSGNLYLETVENER